MNNKLLSAVIIEDEVESLNLLHNLINANGLAEVTGASGDPSEAVNLIVSRNPDIVFLDIKMPGRSGFDVLDDLQKVRSVNPYIIFTTAYDEFAVRAFEYAAFDYLLKPVEPQRLNETLLRCISNKKAGHVQRADLLREAGRKLIFKSISGVVFIDPSEVIYVEAEGNYSVFHMSGSRTETVTMLLGKLEHQLTRQKFFRISRSFIINLDYLKKVSSRQSQCILVKNGSEFRCDISRDRIAELIALMKNR